MSATGIALSARNRTLRIGPWVSVPYRARTLRAAVLVALLIAAVSVSILAMGSYEIPADRVWSVVVQPHLAQPSEQMIVWEFRIPRILLGIIVGAMLGVAGALMQSVTRNGLADPGLIGVSEGATVVILFIIVSQPEFDLAWTPLLGMLGGALVAALVLALSRNLQSARFILIGIGVSATLGATVSMFITYGEIEQVQQALTWMAGSLSGASWDIIARTLPWAVGGVVAAVAGARAADAAMLGEAAAIGLGVRTAPLRLSLIVASVALTAAAVAAIGPMGFVGLIAPHIARFLIGTSQPALVVGSLVCGGAMVLIADSIGRLALSPLQIPAGIVMAILGVPFFLLLLWRRRNAL